MAEVLFRHLAKKSGQDIHVESAGISAGQGQPASRDAVDAVASDGLDLKKFRSQSLTEKLLSEATHVFVMTQDHARLIDLFYPEFVHKVKLLRFEE